jgi:hypothetical protein
MEFVILAVTPIAGRGGGGDRWEPRPGRSGCRRGAFQVRQATARAARTATSRTVSCQVGAADGNTLRNRMLVTPSSWTNNGPLPPSHQQPSQRSARQTAAAFSAWPHAPSRRRALDSKEVSICSPSGEACRQSGRTEPVLPVLASQHCRLGSPTCPASFGLILAVSGLSGRRRAWYARLPAPGRSNEVRHDQCAGETVMTIAVSEMTRSGSTTARGQTPRID